MGVTNVNDPRDIAAYTISEAARYVRIPAPTLRTWVVGSSDISRANRRIHSPPIIAPECDPTRLSFNNIVEAYVLRALRTKHGVSIGAARRAIDEAEHNLGVKRLLLCPELRTHAGELFLDTYSTLINLNRASQLGIRLVLQEYLKCIEVDEANRPARLFPSNRNEKIIVLDSRVAFGRPIIARRGISTSAIVARINAGETEEEIAGDYNLRTSEVEEAVVYEQAA